MVSRQLTIYMAIALLVVLMIAGCSNSQSEQPGSSDASPQNERAESGGSTGEVDATYADEISELRAVTLDVGEKLRVVATTGIVADVVSNVGGDAIELTSLMPAGADPHSYIPTPQDLRTLNDAHVIFINGLGLEESLLPVLENLDRPVPLVSVNVGVETLTLGSREDDEYAAQADEHGHGEADPHTWFSVPNVAIWADNIPAALSALDPTNEAAYRTAAANYQRQLDALDRELRGQIASVPEAQRKLVTDHIALSYLAKEYGFQEVGSVLPSLSTLAAASAQELAALQDAIQEKEVRALFVSTTVNPQTAGQLAQDLGIPVVEVYTGSLSDADGPASTYIKLMRHDVAQIVEALR